MSEILRRRDNRLSLAVGLLGLVLAIACGGGKGGSPTAPVPAAQPYSVGGQLYLQNLGPTDRYTILQAEITFDGNRIANCARTTTPIVNGAQSDCGNIYRVAEVSPGPHTIGCRLIQQNDGRQHNYGCIGAFQVFRGTETLSNRQLPMTTRRMRSGGEIEIQVTVP